MADKKKIGVVLFQLGGPDQADAVEPFLYNLFCDPEIIDFPLAWLARKPLAKWISTRRSKMVGDHYAAIGGFSPIRELTELQAKALAAALSERVDPRVAIAMRYWRPFTQDAIAAFDGQHLDQIVLLPLYPQYSFATTRSSLKEWSRLYTPLGIPVKTIDSFYDHPDYIAAVVDRISSKMAQLERPDEVFLVFSAHGLPLTLVARGDPYPKHIEATARIVRERGGWKNPNILCYQSRVGRQKWLEPSLTSTIERLAHEGVRRMMVIPISFVTEHIETLHEINIEAREEAGRLGVQEFTMMPALNDSPLFIRALADLVLKVAGIPKPVSLTS
ncbi:MAG: ferrochelatase [Candidatus Acidiferrales bacterium]